MSIDLKPIIERTPQSGNLIHPHPIINRVLQNRGIESMDDITYSLKGLIEPFAMLNMDKAVIMLERHMKLQSRVVVVGDFDCDGATSTSIAVEGLRLMGFESVNFIIPDRVIHGYGLTPSIVQLAGEMEPDLIVTVDNGIASFDGADAVRALPKRCELLVTDHHLPAEKGLPDADCIVNPSQIGCEFPSKALAGCGVMFYVIMAFRSYLRDQGYYTSEDKPEPNIAPLIDLVSLGTVADVVPLDFNNRILIDAGLKRIRAGYGRPGIKAILDVAGKDQTKIIASDFGFAVGPRINAAGRLEDMSQGINCLLSTNYDEAFEMATRLDDLNKQRRDIELDHVFDAGTYIEKYNLRDRKGVIIHDPSWHPGVVGIVASRVKDKLNRPVICMTDTETAQNRQADLDALIDASADHLTIEAAREALGDSEVKGSARSIPGVHLKHVLDHIAKSHPHILTKFGGHAMAAGLSLRKRYLQEFMELFDQEVAAVVTPEQLLGSVEVDIKNASAEFINLDLAREIRTIGPWGQCFPEPIFHARFKVLSTRVLKEKHLKMVLAFEGGNGQKFDAIAFGCVENGELPVGDSFDGAFVVDINEYPPGKENLQLMMRELQDPDRLTIKKTPDPTPVVNSEPVEREVLTGSHVSREVKIVGLPNQDNKTPMNSLREDLQAMIKEMKNKKKHTEPGIEP